MATIKLNQDEFLELKSWNDNGDVARVWNYLGSKGDAYAFLAGPIVDDDVDGMDFFSRYFYEMVRSHWQNTGVGEGGSGAEDNVWGGPVFDKVAQAHVSNYLTFLSTQNNVVNNTYALPDTLFIEASYRDALEQYGLPPITAIDSVFSVVDYALGDGSSGVRSLLLHVE